ncbi:TetR/AcrR family transcriptional regulator [Streptomyces sp. XM4011]|uniref:TetR/AcrR family transcriptional regulator n=1 Tax=Streptomyces sp. XM4011 TaxID=2929780 RepID=UPI001FF8DE07|nr:TetR/AcrR family transcriptional regulator C-terminal domain-containing protein [Streptomyces sp. XM4011]MCK1817753.1 TetR/AcrR family transcriptional regulator [Streptomyces sp. XM4011]
MSAIWFGEQPPERKPRLSRERITEAAVAVLDADGPEGLSMRRLAARLDAGVMSLYAYVSGKEDVLDLAVDAAVARIATDGLDGLSWREAVRHYLSRSRTVMLRHPWLPALMATRPLLGPHALARSELVYALLHRAGLDGPRLTVAVGALTAYAQGFTAAENMWRGRVGRAGPGGEAELRRAAQEYLAVRHEAYPTLAAHADLGNDDFDTSFGLGLDTILDGIAAQLPGPPSR